MKREVDRSSPLAWDTGRKFNRYVQVFKLMVLVSLLAGISWVVVEMEGIEIGKGARKPLPKSTYKDPIAEKARTYVETVGKEMAHGEVYGTIDGTTRKLAADEVKQMQRTEQIRQVFRQLQASYVTAQNLKGAQASEPNAAHARSYLSGAKNKAVDSLAAFSRQEVERVFVEYRKLLEPDPEAKQFFEGVVSIPGGGQ